MEMVSRSKDFKTEKRKLKFLQMFPFELLTMFFKKMLQKTSDRVALTRREIRLVTYFYLSSSGSS